jgi:hypothetical protein
MLTDNEKKFVERFVNHLHYVANAQQEIKEKFGVDSAYDEETNTLFIARPKGVNESFNTASAKKYALDLISEEWITVEYDAE